MWYDDRAWVEAAEAAAKFAGHHVRCFGPPEFAPFIEGLLPLEYSECQDDVTFFVCPKDDVDLLSTRVIDRLDAYTCVFANDVFVAYSSLPGDGDKPSAETGRHLPYFLDKVAALKAGTPIRSGGLNSRYPEGDFSAARKGRRVLVVNAGGMDDFGDEILAEATCKLCREAKPDAEIIVAGPSVDRSVITAADHIVLAGGGGLYEFLDDGLAPDLRHLANCFKFGYYAKQYGATFTVLGLGHQQRTQGFITSAGPRFLRGALAHASAITTRDFDTLDLLRHAIIEPGYSGLQVGEDVSFALLHLLPERAGPVRRVTLVGGRLTRSAALRAMLVALHEAGCSIRVVIQANEDPALSETIRNEMPDLAFDELDLRPMSVQEGIAAFQDTDGVITARFHAFVMAVMGGIPVLALDHENGKNERLARRLFGEAWSDILFRQEETGEQRVGRLLSGELPQPHADVLEEVKQKARFNEVVLGSAWRSAAQG